MSYSHARRMTLAVALSVFAFTAVGAQRAPTMAGRSPVYAPNGAAATSQPLATTAALAVLQKGGNAVDAAITAAAVLSVVEPMMTGVGGDMFALMWSAKEKKLVALNASGRAGSLMTREELVKRGRTRIPRGIETVTVPGAVAGWDALLKKYGTMTLAQVLEPAINYAEHGFVVTPVISGDWAGQRAILMRDEGAKATFLPNGEPPKAGDYFRNPDLAATALREALEEALFTGLRLARGLDVDTVRTRYHADIWTLYGEGLERFREAGLLIYDGRLLRLSRAGMLLANEIMSEFVSVVD